MNGIEKGLDVHPSRFAAAVDGNLNHAARDHFPVEGLRQQLVAVVEVELAFNLLYGGVHKHLAGVKDDYWVYDILQVLYLMGGDHHDGILPCESCHGLAELGF